LIVVLSGVATVLEDEDKTATISVGEAHYIPPETRHAVENRSDAPLTYVYTVALFD
jgi:mannose-6-phosphate isomerase-like protein (cupin superfamily)